MDYFYLRVSYAVVYVTLVRAYYVVSVKPFDEPPRPNKGNLVFY
jgi:hypothetical protein